VLLGACEELGLRGEPARRKKVLCEPASAQSRMRLTGQAMGYKMAINTHTSLHRHCQHYHHRTPSHTPEQGRIPDEVGADGEAVARTQRLWQDSAGVEPTPMSANQERPLPCVCAVSVVSAVCRVSCVS
jgi:hypothetical protein